jgi:hypothetical protein
MEAAQVPEDVRIALGHALVAVGPHWRACLLLCDAFARHFHGFVLERFLPSTMLQPWLHSSGLMGCHAWRPLMTGKELAKMGIQGPAVGLTMARIQEWRFLHPTATAEDCEQWLARSTLQPEQ